MRLFVWRAIGPGSLDPFDGKIVRDESSQPNGILLKGALCLVEKIIPKPGPVKVRMDGALGQ